MDLQPLSTIKRTYRHAQRYRQILSVLVRYGFQEFVQALHIDRYIDIGAKTFTLTGEPIPPLTRMERIRGAIEELGPTFIKIGQVLSTRPDQLPLDLIVELQKLQDNVLPFPFAEVRAIIEADLGRPITEIFKHFQEPALAAASIGQVHRAMLPNGEVVAVKVRRPSVEATLEVDLEILMHIATLAEKHVGGFDVQRPTLIVAELKETLRREIDYRREATNMERFAHQFAGDPTIRVPRVYREVSTERILVQEWIEGIKVFDVERLRDNGLDCALIAHRGALLMLQQIFVHGFFHADPHPGNIFILPDNVVCFIDLGMMGRLQKHGRDNLIDLLTAIVTGDDAAAVDALLELTIWTEEPNRRDLEADVSEFVQMNCFGPLKNINLGRVLHDLMEHVGKHRLRIPPNLYMVIKALSTLEGIGRNLDPEFDVIGEAAPVVRGIQKERFQLKGVGKTVVRSAKEFAHLVRALPRELRSLVHQLRLGKIKIEFEHVGLEPLEHTIDRVMNRLAFAIVTAALIIGSAVVIHSKIPPRWNDISLIGLIGFLLAGVMGFRLIISISRSGKL